VGYQGIGVPYATLGNGGLTTPLGRQLRP